MKKSDIISILITFVVGVVAGGYLYLTGFAPIESEVAVPDGQELEQFVIVGDIYGGCRNNCPSFRVINDGSYRFLYTPTIGGSQKTREGKLPYALFKKLRSVATASELEKQSQKMEPADCSSYSDGFDVLYEITLNGKLYVINSCGSAADGKSALWLSLQGVWDYFETI